MPDIAGPVVLKKNWRPDAFKAGARHISVMVTDSFPDEGARTKAVETARRVALERYTEAYPDEPLDFSLGNVTETIHHMTVQVVYSLWVEAILHPDSQPLIQHKEP